MGKAERRRRLVSRLVQCLCCVDIMANPGRASMPVKLSLDNCGINNPCEQALEARVTESDAPALDIL